MTDLITEYAAYLASPRVHRAESTITTYIEILTRVDRDLPYGLSRACEEELDGWIFDRDLKPASQRLYRAAVRGYFKWAMDPRRPHLKGVNPADLLDPVTGVERGRPRPIPAGQYADILNRAREPYRTWYLLAALTGARCCELAELDRGDITQDRVLLHGKGGKDRYVPAHEAVQALAATLPPGLVARGLDRRQVSGRGNHHMQKVLGHRDVSMHRWRHTYLTGVYDDCQDLLVAKALAGHATVATTEIYVQPREQAMRRAVASLRAA